MRRKKNPPRGTRKNVRITIYPKTGRSAGRATSKKRKTSRRQTGGFLNRYDFAYAGRDVVNQVGKVAPKLLTGNWRNKQNCSAENRSSRTFGCGRNRTCCSKNNQRYHRRSIQNTIQIAR